MIVKPDGSEAFETARSGPVSDAERLGGDAGRELKGRAGPDFFALTCASWSPAPSPTANAPRRQLRARGHEVMLAPLLRVEIVPDAELGAGPWAAVLFTSANGARAHRRASAARRT